MSQAEINSNFMKIKRAKTTINRRSSPPDLVAMRTWKGKRGITRTVVLLTCLDGILKPGSLVEWLETPISKLNGRAPIDLLALGKWTAVGDVIDDMLTGAPS